MRVNPITIKSQRPLIEALRHNNQRYAKMAELLFFDWPKAKLVALGLLDYVSLNIRRDDEAVAILILSEALNAYSEAVYFTSIPDGKRSEDAKRLAIFVDVLVQATCRDLQIQVENERGEGWSLSVGEPFLTWLKHHDGDLTIYRKPLNAEQPVRAMLYGAITPDSVKRTLQRAGYENAILADCLAISR